MTQISLLISPEVKSAYFSDYIECATAELKYCFPNLRPVYRKVGSLDFLDISIDESEIEGLSRLSFFQGSFISKDEALIPMSLKPSFKLHESFIFGSKFKGKTNERFTQLMLNIGLSSIVKKKNVKVLDPMCGRGTTLLWCMRYGLNSKGVELDSKSLLDVKQIVKKWSKVCSISSKVNEGFVGKKTKSNVGKFLEFFSQDSSFKIVIGDSINCYELLGKERFDLLISDIPYGIQHMTSKSSITPMLTLKECLPKWKSSLNDEGAIVIGFNSNNPKRKELESLALELGFSIVDFEVPHRMSESIIRDILVLKK